MASYYPKQEASNCKLRQQLRVYPLKDFQVSVIIIANGLKQKNHHQPNRWWYHDYAGSIHPANQLSVPDDTELKGS